MKIKDLNKSKTPIVKVVQNLNPKSNQPLFPEKLAQANKRLSKFGTPDLIKH